MEPLVGMEAYKTAIKHISPHAMCPKMGAHGLLHFQNGLASTSQLLKLKVKEVIK